MRFAITLISLAFLATGCTGSQFGGAAGKVGGGKKESSGDKKPEGQGLGNPDDDEEETGPADDPVMVSGAYLTCVEDDKLPQNEQTITAGCVLKDKGGKKLSLDGVDAKWAVIDLFNTDTGAAFVPLPQDAAYHVTAVVPRAGIENLRGKLLATRNGGVREYIAPIQASGDTNKSVPLPNMKEFGKADDYQLGDDNYENQGGCTWQLQKIGLSGSSLVFQINVKAKSKLAITMGHICGVTLDVNTVRVRDGSPTPLFDGLLPLDARDFVVPALDLEPGAYTFEIHSPKWNGDPIIAPVGDRDDFVIGDFRFVYDGDVEVSDPVSNQVIEN